MWVSPETPCGGHVRGPGDGLRASGAWPGWRGGVARVGVGAWSGLGRGQGGMGRGQGVKGTWPAVGIGACPAMSSGAWPGWRRGLDMAGGGFGGVVGVGWGVVGVGLGAWPEVYELGHWARGCKELERDCAQPGPPGSRTVGLG